MTVKEDRPSNYSGENVDFPCLCGELDNIRTPRRGYFHAPAGNPRIPRYRDAARSSQLRSDRSFLQAALLPADIHLETAASAQAADGTLRPGGGQGRQQAQGTFVTLQQHLDDTGCHAEVAVDLEGRVGVEQVGIQPAS